MFKIIHLRLEDRAVVLKNGLPFRALGPGRHFVWGFGLSTSVWNTDELVFRAQPAVRAVLPRDWFAELELGPRERAVLVKDGRPLVFLRPGVHRYWTVDPTLRVRRFDVEQPLPELTDELGALIPKREIVEATVLESERGLLFVQGKLARVLEPGRHAFWTHPEAEVSVSKLDMRADQDAIVGQELMTRDKVTLRLTLTVEHAVADPVLAATAVANVRNAVYLLVQLAARDYVAGVTLDQLLEGRDAMTRHLMAEVAPKALGFGVRVDRVGVKDVVLPGEMKTLLNRVIEAEKAAAANVILRREEVAATRQLANTVRVMEQSPILLRLKELDALKEIAESIGEVRLVVGADNMKALLPAELLGRGLALPSAKTHEPTSGQ
ncbi:MAG: slipin family protein [Myxococcales bacterium]|nr:slipin family protein [Myxococcales bacterium]